ncbi:unnamed protein product [Clavelina lepadiformis]|uniref:Uncharacterized protein n=1 Tax=Clavelina lepadiformis TaxID=159417 RepID=A0ABP0FZC3_CLALP
MLERKNQDVPLVTSTGRPERSKREDESEICHQTFLILRICNNLISNYNETISVASATTSASTSHRNALTKRGSLELKTLAITKHGVTGITSIYSNDDDAEVEVVTALGSFEKNLSQFTNSVTMAPVLATNIDTTQQKSCSTLSASNDDVHSTAIDKRLQRQLCSLVKQRIRQPFANIAGHFKHFLAQNVNVRFKLLGLKTNYDKLWSYSYCQLANSILEVLTPVLANVVGVLRYVQPPRFQNGSIVVELKLLVNFAIGDVNKTKAILTSFTEQILPILHLKGLEVQTETLEFNSQEISRCIQTT